MPSVYFDTDKATLREKGEETLDTLIRVLRQNKVITKIRVEGHTDHRASKRYNTKLAQKRVDSVVQYLKDRGVSAEIETIAFGELAPLDHSKTEEGMQHNRRVDIRITAFQE